MVLNYVYMLERLVKFDIPHFVQSFAVLVDCDFSRYIPNIDKPSLDIHINGLYVQHLMRHHLKGLHRIHKQLRGSQAQHIALNKPTHSNHPTDIIIDDTGKIPTISISFNPDQFGQIDTFPIPKALLIVVPDSHYNRTKKLHVLSVDAVAKKARSPFTSSRTETLKMVF